MIGKILKKQRWRYMKSFIFGAKSVAIGVCRAIRSLYPENQISGFLVSSLENNPEKIEGIDAREIKEVGFA